MLLRTLPRRFTIVPKSCLSTAVSRQENGPPTSKEALMALRRKTGYPFNNCKKALDKFGLEDSDSALKWLHEQAQKEGWGKVDLTDRTAAQGVVAASAQGSHGVLLELNCETDFVAKNEKFRALASVATLCTLTHLCNKYPTAKIGENGEIINPEIEPGELLELCAKDILNTGAFQSFFHGFQGNSLGDLLAFTLGYVKERLDLKRVSGLVVPENDLVVPYAHPRTNDKGKVLLGHFGSLVGVHRIDDDISLNSLALGQQICQHIVGMNPVEMGKMVDDSKDENIEEQIVQGEENTEEKAEESKGEKGDTKLNDEKRLLHQDFLLNPSISVAKYLTGHNAQILAFHRFRCGQQ